MELSLSRSRREREEKTLLQFCSRKNHYTKVRQEKGAALNNATTVQLQQKDQKLGRRHRGIGSLSRPRQLACGTTVGTTTVPENTEP